MSAPPEMRTPALAGAGDAVFRKSALETYRIPLASATDLAAAFIARRYRLTPPLAREVCRLAGIGGEA